MYLKSAIYIAVAKQVMLWEPQLRWGSHNQNHLNPLGGCYSSLCVDFDYTQPTHKSNPSQYFGKYSVFHSHKSRYIKLWELKVNLYDEYL